MDQQKNDIVVGKETLAKAIDHQRPDLKYNASFTKRNQDNAINHQTSFITQHGQTHAIPHLVRIKLYDVVPSVELSIAWKKDV